MDLEAEKRFHSLLQRALDLEGDEWTLFLDEACRDEPTLLRRLRGALETVDEGLLQQPSEVEQAALEELAFGVPPHDLADGPITIGPYELIELLGSGGMGRVFLAEQKHPFRRRVALKLLKTSFVSQETLIRFKAEQQALARLDHPNVGRILEAGATEDGAPFFAMELVSGEPLIKYCDVQKLSLEDRLRLMIAVCRGVEHAHRKQILHRDLKGSNILVSQVDGEAVPKIIDFGIAKAMDQPLTEATLATGGFLGTPTYMSPEALSGTGDLDTRTDVYSLGVLLYKLLTGVKPYEADSGSFAHLVLRIRSEKTPRPSTRWGHLATEHRQRFADDRQLTVGELERRLRHELDWVVLKALAKDRERRYGSAEALAEDLERYLDHQPLLASPPSVSYRVGKFLQRHRLAVGFTSLLLILFCVALGYHLQSRQEVSDRTADLTREVERIEWIQRVAYQLPKGDRSTEHDLIRQGMARIESTMDKLGKLDGGAGSYALGRGALALRKLDEANGHLDEAWRDKYRRPEAALTRGLVLSELYERELDSIQKLSGKTIRQVARQRAGEQYRDPAIDMLTAGRPASVAVPYLLEAQIALLRSDRSTSKQPDLAAVPSSATEAEAAPGSDLDDVLALSMQALVERPWLYEAYFLRSRALERQAGQAERGNNLERAAQLLEQAEEEIRQGLTIGRSDPDGHLKLCKMIGKRMGFELRHLRPDVEALKERTLDACRAVREIDPTLDEVDLEEAFVWLNWMDVEIWDLNQDPSESLDKATALLAGIGDTSKRSYLAYSNRAQGQIMLSSYQERNGIDPREAWTSAIELLEKALELEPRDPSLHERLCRVLAQRAHFEMNRGKDVLADLDRAVEHGVRAVNGGPDELTANLYLASAYVYRISFMFERGGDLTTDAELGRQAYEELKRRWPTNAAADNGLANLYMIFGRWQDKMGLDPRATFDLAIDHGDENLRLRPDSPFGLLTRGQLKLWQAIYTASQGRDPGEWTHGSRQDLESGLEKLPNVPGPYVDLGRLALAEGRLLLSQRKSPIERVEWALQRAGRAWGIDDNRADARRVMAEAELLRAAWQLRQGQNATSSLRRADDHAAAALAMEPHDVESHLVMARYAWRMLQSLNRPQGDVMELGLEHCSKAAEIDPTDQRVTVLRGALLVEDPARRDEGETLVDQALKANPNLRYLWQIELQSKSGR